MPDAEAEPRPPFGRPLLLGCLLIFVPPFLVSSSPPFGVGVGVVLTLRALGFLMWITFACHSAKRASVSRAWSLLALLGVPGLLILAAILDSPSEKRPARPSRFSFGGCLVVVLFSPLVLLQALIAVMSVVVVPIVGTVFLHTWPFWQDERTGKAFPFLAVLLVHPFSAVIALFGVARLLAVVDLLRDRIRRPVPAASPPVEAE